MLRVSYRILSWDGGGEHDRSRMIVVCESTLTHACACLLEGGGGGSGSMPPGKC